MAPSCISIIAIVLCFSPFISCFYIANARPYVQKLDSRALYQGGWALALSGSGSTCTSDAPNPCSTSGSINLACCPSGQTCFLDTSDSQYCCPTDASCYTAVKNFPVCANTSWIMFEYESSWFCCEPGQIAVIPLTGLGGICEPADQVIPKTLLATVASQVTAAPAATNSGTATAKATTTGTTNSVNPTETNPTSTSTTTNPTGSPSSSGLGGTHISLGGWIGIGIAVIVVVLIIIAMNKCSKSRTVKVIPQSSYVEPPQYIGVTDNRYPEMDQQHHFGRVEAQGTQRYEMPVDLRGPDGHQGGCGG